MMQTQARLAFAAVILASAIATAPAAHADQEKNRFSVGGFLGWDFLDDEIELGNSFFADQVPESAFLLGLRGAFDIITLAPESTLAPRLSLELEGKLAFSSAAGNTTAMRDDTFAPVFGWRGHAMLSFFTANEYEHPQPFIVVGGGGETVTTGSDFIDSPDTDAAFHWGLGLRYMIQPKLSVRADFRQVITAGRFDYLSFNHEVHIGVGYHFSLLSSAPTVVPPVGDSDGDGFNDDVDKCPDAAEDKDGYEDEDGCPEDDNDGDGIADTVDKCPLEPENRNGVDDEDGCPEVDSDGDGLFGSQDKCPDAAEDKDAFEDEDGCPDLDNDGDGRPDNVDKCPLKPETLNGFQDEDGCPDVIPKKLAKFTGRLKGIRFKSGSARILPSSRKALDKAAAILNEFPSIQVEISGHTDSSGKLEYNQNLSKGRADSVRNYLVGMAIDPTRVITVGYGPAKPVATNKTRRGRAQNRRIEFNLLAGPQVVGPKGTTTPPPSPSAPKGSPAPTPPTGSSPQ